jgi:transcription termination factor Rho
LTAAWRETDLPSINVNRSGTRREELLIKSDILQKIWVQEAALPDGRARGDQFLVDKLRATKNNSEFSIA